MTDVQEEIPLQPRTIPTKQQSNSRNTNLQTYQQKQQNLSFSQYITNDFWTNLTVISLPLLFTNFCWRIMNLYGIGVTHYVWTDIAYTTLKIATIVFLICFIIDCLRQILLNIFTIPVTVDNKLMQAIKVYWTSKGMMHSLKLGSKFFLACVLWTAAYEMIAGEHQIFASVDYEDQSFGRSFAAGLGSAIGLILVSQLILFFEYCVLKNKEIGSGGFRACWLITNQREIFGISFKTFFEGFVWSLVGDQNWYLVLYEKYGLSYGSSAFLDSLILGVLSSLAYTGAGIFLSVCGYIIDERGSDVILNVDVVENIEEMQPLFQ